MPLNYSKGELLDRYAIELRKSHYGAQNGKFLLDLVASIREHQWSANDVMDAIENAVANADIANLEWQVREGRNLSNEEIGIRAKAIRRINATRVSARNSIDGRKDSFVPAFGTDVPADKITLEVQDVAS